MDLVNVQNENKCYLCECTDQCRRPGKVRDDTSLKILECRGCGLVFLALTELPEGFYEQSCMHSGEPPPVEAWLRDTVRDDERRFRYLSEAMTNIDLLDFGCGNGGFLLKARSNAHHVMGIELEERLQPHFQTNCLEVFQTINDLPSDQYFDLITAFHVVEHLKDPAKMLRQMAMRLRSGGRIIIEVPSSNDALLTLYKNTPFAEFTYWSCHRYLFNAVNLPLLARKANLKLDYIRHIQRYPLSNHLYWLTKGKPGGHQLWSFLDSEELSKAYETVLANLGRTDTLLVSLSV